MECSSIGQQIGRFILATLEKCQPTQIVTVERKGTALLRTFIEVPSGQAACRLGWEDVLSSHALRFQKVSEFLRDEGTILLLDDGMYGGIRMRDTLKMLLERDVPRQRIKTAAFSSHEKSPSKPDFYWLGHLDADTYSEVRSAVVAYFQQQGSLLLDTEHLEVPVDINCGRLEFFEALCRAGIGVEHMSAGGRVNLTVYNPLLLDEAGFLGSLPKGTTIRNVVRKIRVVERDKNRFAVIPIFYPSTPADCSPDSLAGLDDCLNKLADDPETNFHLVGVFAAMCLFKTVFACLRDLVMEDKVRVRVPAPQDADDPISHMKALFPALDVAALHRSLECYVEMGRKRKLPRRHALEPRRIEAVGGTKYGKELERLHWLTLREIRRLSEDVPGGPQGATLAELLRIVSGHEEPHVAEALLSAAQDQAIDSANVVTDDAAMPFSDGLDRVVRVFKLDGEIVGSDVRMGAAAWRQPLAPPSYAEREWQWT